MKFKLVLTSTPVNYDDDEVRSLYCDSAKSHINQSNNINDLKLDLQFETPDLLASYFTLHVHKQTLLHI